MHRFIRTIPLLCGLLLALPPGWCCAVPTAAESPRLPAREDGEPPVKHCCCSGDAMPAPAEPNPISRPAHPAEACCCEATATVLPDLVRYSVEQAVESVHLAGFAEFRVPPLMFVPREPAPVAASPPLNVLHCVWLC